MQAPARIADALDQHALDETVHVFVGAVDESRVGLTALTDPGEGLPDFLAAPRREPPGAAKRPRPREAAGHVFVEQPPVEAKGLLELERRGIGRGVESSRPERAHEATIAS